MAFQLFSEEVPHHRFSFELGERPDSLRGRKLVDHFIDSVPYRCLEHLGGIDSVIRDRTEESRVKRTEDGKRQDQIIRVGRTHPADEKKDQWNEQQENNRSAQNPEFVGEDSEDREVAEDDEDGGNRRQLGTHFREPPGNEASVTEGREAHRRKFPGGA